VSGGAIEAQLRAATPAYRAVRAAGLVPGGDASFELDPTRVWRRVRQPVLLLYGDRDRAVPPQASATIIASALERAGNRAYSVRIFGGANHAMVLASDRFTTFVDYHRGVEHPPGYFDTMTEWMRQPAAGAVVPADHGRQPGPVERLRSVDGRPWHESPVVQLGLLALFLTVFLARSLAGSAQALGRVDGSIARSAPLGMAAPLPQGGHEPTMTAFAATPPGRGPQRSEGCAVHRAPR
jgi:hypothetical protein